MKKQYALLFFLLLQIGLFAQNRIANGYIYDKDSLQALKGAAVIVSGTPIRAISNESGKFSLQIPDGACHLIISMEGYFRLNYILDNDFHNKLNVIYLESVKTISPATETILPLKDTRLRDSIFLTHKNTISLSLLELFSTAIAMRYERFLHPRHAIGLHASYYILGRSNLDPHVIYSDYVNGATYTGFKATPFYRYYFLRKGTMGLYADAKVQFGYFSFDNIWYMYSHRTGFAKPSSFDFRTWGGGISLGIMTRMPKTKNAILNFSVGYQYFPTPIPENYIRQNGDGTTSILKPDTDWWYKNGPGGRFEVKLTLGGIF
jgi:hypothetical protein